jgi:hypothetical protein
MINRNENDGSDVSKWLLGFLGQKWQNLGFLKLDKLLKWKQIKCATNMAKNLFIYKGHKFGETIHLHKTLFANQLQENKNVV